MCKEFSVGRSIARRALRYLEQDGLVEIEENRGARVSATTVEEVFDLYELRAALYGLAARVACMRATDEEIVSMSADIDRMLEIAADGYPADEVIEASERIFSRMVSFASADAQQMVASVRRKTHFHFSYAALALNNNSLGAYDFWRDVRAGLASRDADAVAQAARNILYFMQGEVARIMLSRRPRTREQH
ncbi:MAG: hypothetical protein CVT78_13050 [Alphaproteobacteria bacterium HGW-Alphaproteobacteria-17]|nr:MAG: hypothetical protein CVT78_13050 [Alphaproteobacteria bacterium HGW-Alphaproteobacteria-17]